MMKPSLEAERRQEAEELRIAQRDYETWVDGSQPSNDPETREWQDLIEYTRNAMIEGFNAPELLDELLAELDENKKLKALLTAAEPILDTLLERSRLHDRMTQPSMGRHPLEDEADHLDAVLRKKSRPITLYPLVKDIKEAIKGSVE
jgi:hypothetical protein